MASCSCSCCTAMMELCAPDGSSVVAFLDAGAQTTTYHNADGSPWVGDPDTLTRCGGGGVVDVCAAINATCPATAVDNGDGTFTVTGTDGSSITFCGCGSIVDNGDGSYTWTGPDGSTVTWDTNDTIVSVDPGNVISEGSDSGAYLSAAGVCAAVNANCPSSAVDNGDGTVTVTGTDGSTVTVDASDTTYVLVDNTDGSFTLTGTDGSSVTIPICDLLSGLTSTGAELPAGTAVLGADCQWHLLPAGTTDTFVTFADNGDGTATFTSADGGTAVAVCTGPCDHTAVAEVDNGDGTFTYTATMPDGTVTSWTTAGDSFVTVVNNGNGTFSATNVDGSTITWTGADIDTFMTAVDNGDGTATFTTVDGTAITVCTDCGSASIVDNGDGTYTATNPDGTTVTWDVNEVIVSADAGNVISTGTDGGALLTAQNVCDAINATCPASAVLNPDGSFTVTGNDGVAATFTPAAETATTLVPGPNPFTYVYTNELGVQTTIDVNELDADINNVTVAGAVMTFTAEDGTVVTANICDIVNANCAATAADNGDGTYTITGTDGSQVTITGDTDTNTAIVDNGDGTYTATMPDGTIVTWSAGSASTLVDNNDGSITHDDGTGTTITVSVCDLLDNLPVTGAVLPDGRFVLGSDCQWHLPPAGAVDTFVSFADNGDGTATFTSADGASTVAVCTGPCDHASVADNGDGTYTATNVDGSTITWTGDTDTDTFMSGVDNGDGTATFTSADGATTITVCTDCDHAAVADNGDGTYTATNPDGSTVTWAGGPDVGQAVVVDNGDGTTTVTGTATDGTVTTDVVLNDLLVNAGAFGVSRSVDPDADIFLTEANIADGTAIDPATTDPIVKLADGSLAVMSDPQSCIKLTKSQSTTGPYVEGAQIDYVFVVENCGGDDLSNVTVTDPLLTVAGGPIALPVGGVDSATFTGSYVVTAADVANGIIYNTATAAGVDPNGNPVTDDDSDVAVAIECTDQLVCGVTSGTATVPLTSLTIDSATQATFLWDNGASLLIDITSGINDDGTPIDLNNWEIQTPSAALTRLADFALAESFTGTATFDLNTSPDANGCSAPVSRVRFGMFDHDNGPTCTALEDLSGGLPIQVLGDLSSASTSVYGATGTEVCVTSYVDGADFNINLYGNVTSNPPINQQYQFAYYPLGGVDPVGLEESDRVGVLAVIWAPTAVQVTTDCLGNFISAVDAGGNTYTEAEVTF